MELQVRLHGTQAGGTLALEERDRAINHIRRRDSPKADLDQGRRRLGPSPTPASTPTTRGTTSSSDTVVVVGIEG